MGLLNKKTIILDLEKLSFNCSDEVNGVIKFDFGEDIVKANKITIGLNRKVSSREINALGSGKIDGTSVSEYNYLLETNILGKGEYTKEEIPFKFIIPNNAIRDDISFTKLLDKIPKALKPIAEILIDMFAPSMRKRYSFEIIARIDIPWGIDIRERVSINIKSD